MPNYAYHFARVEGRFVRFVYRTLLPLIVRYPIFPPRTLPLDVFSYSGQATLPEQVASIRSFLKHAGCPQQFTVVSDGSYSESAKSLISSIHPCVTVVPLPDIANELPVAFRAYLTAYPTGKQLALMMSLPRGRPALYLDSDVLFFAGARQMQSLAQRQDVSALYLADCQFSGDDRLLRSDCEREQPINSGVYLSFREMDWSLGIQRFIELEAAPNFFTNQTLMHLVAHANNAQPLDPATFVLQLDDQTLYRDRYVSEAIVLRHYVNPVRHKFWTTLWRT